MHLLTQSAAEGDDVHCVRRRGDHPGRELPRAQDAQVEGLAELQQDALQPAAHPLQAQQLRAQANSQSAGDRLVLSVAHLGSRDTFSQPLTDFQGSESAVDHT